VLTADALARELGVFADEIADIVYGRRLRVSTMSPEADVAAVSL
jgi:hypothetical protein